MKLVAALAAAAALSLVALAAAPRAEAAHGPAPWVGGTSVVSAVEARIGAVSAEISERPDSAGHCFSPGDWGTLAASAGLSPDDLFAAVPLLPAGPASFMLVSPQVCTPLDEFLAKPARRGQKECEVSFRTETQAKTVSERYRARVRKKVRGAWTTVVVWRSRTVVRQVPVKIPIYGECPAYKATVNAIQTIAHEAMHIAGVVDEPAAECFGLQLTTLVASRFGADIAFSLEIGRDYVPLYADFVRQSPDYATPDCYDGGPLDLWPAQPGWPVPASAKVVTTPPAAATASAALLARWIGTPAALVPDAPK